MSTNFATSVELIQATTLYQGAKQDEKTYIDNHMTQLHEGLTEAHRVGYDAFANNSEMEWELMRVIRQIFKDDEGAKRAADNLVKFGAIIPFVMSSYEVGAILSDCWGWEQTNYDFYCIVAKSGDFVTIMPMKATTSAEIGFMTNDKAAEFIDWTGTPQRKKLKRGHMNCVTGFTLRPYAGGGWCKLWDGKNKRATSYA